MDQNKLIDLAWKARENAYVPYSHFKVGACIALKDGTFVQGCNIENAAYGSTTCAERNAVFGAYCKGYRKEEDRKSTRLNSSHTLASRMPSSA